MKNRKNRNIIIASLMCLLIFMGVGYAVLSSTLLIKGSASLAGKWNIHIESIEATTTNGSANAGTPKIDQNKLGASFDAQLNKPGDYVEYTIVVKNAGSIPAVLTELKPNISGENIEDIILTHTMIHGQILKGETSTTFTLRVLYDDRATDIATGTKAEFDIELLYTQWDGNEANYDLVTQPVTANDCFTIDENGTITNYNSLCGTYVTVPEKVNGITVTKIAEAAFKSYDTTFYANESTGKTIIIVNNIDKYSIVQTFVANVIESGDIEQGNVQIVVPGKDSYDLTGFASIGGRNFTSDGTLEETGYANIEYLDLSQAKSLTFIDAMSFASSEGTSKLKYLNIYGLNLTSTEKMDSIFNNVELEELTIGTDLKGINWITEGLTVNKLRILKETSTIVDSISSATVNTLIIGEGITEIKSIPDGLVNLTLPSTLTDITKLTSAITFYKVTNTTSNITITMNHRKKPSFYNDTSWYNNSQYITVNWPYISQ